MAFLSFSVLNEDISNEIKFSHPLNMLTIKYTLEVTNDDKFKDIKDLQLENTLFICSTFEVLKLFKFIYFKLWHSANIKFKKKRIKTIEFTGNNKK